MARAARICAKAGCPNTVYQRGHCRAHYAERMAEQRRTTPTKVAERRERTLRKRFIQEWVRRHGYWCPGYKRPAHASRDLTVEHATAVADHENYRTDTSGWTVLCRSCNSRHGAETRNRYR